MPKEEWGVKRVCPTTGKRFYDMNRNPVVSPYTGETINIETGKRSLLSADAEDAVTKKSKTSEDDLETDVLDEDDVEVDLDADVLEDDDDDNVSLDEIADVASDDDD
ncbi:TIGR02300 family protein [Aquicoccus porphyridii]|uniref:TIGR02300 family protein n=1 Tax=Aquicoccus porphyridii TaxID=1852029 RepID=A0A5A9ZKP4_9RHOB|nr:TIGR02300 family protein [Aquicoccus porphyridii]KAA0917556.1 TIGR02300 family protein [Aquicoccus porphyridii]RAI55635.1 TIGR02300 family protein [Rhodobacteraceae bacterium AsT-22]